MLFHVVPARRSHFTLVCAALTLWSGAAHLATASPPLDQRVLLLSVDGLHEVDLARYIRLNPTSAMARVASNGVHYTSATTVRPSDSFPTFLALVTGGSPISTGVWYDDNYDRSLWPPGVTSGPTGVGIVYNETIDYNGLSLDGGGGINPLVLPRDPARGGAVVYPHDFLRVNTIFEVVKAAGGHTAYCEKHLSYEIAHGPSGQGVEDLYTPEIAADNLYRVSITKSVAATEAYDDLKVNAVLAQINGLDHTSNTVVGVPALFGMNFQAISVAQRIRNSLTATNKNISQSGFGGYVDGLGTPGPLLTDALNHTDTSIGRILNELDRRALGSSTFVILVGKHGNSPMDTNRIVIAGVAGGNNPVAVDLQSIVASVTPVLKVTADDVGLIWLADQSQAALAAAVLHTNQNVAYIQDVFFGDGLKTYWDDPLTDPRTPDLVVFPKPGVIFTTSTKKIAEHGGAAEDDTHVALVVSHPGLQAAVCHAPVNTTQVAPTILELLGLNPLALKAVVQERTQLLPGFEPLSAGLNPPFTPGSFAFDPAGTVHALDGTTQLQLFGLQTRSYLLQRSTDLSTWTTFATNNLVVRGTATVSDPGGPIATNTFYRAVSITP